VRLEISIFLGTGSYQHETAAGAMLDDWFHSDPIKAVLGFDAVVGSLASPYTRRAPPMCSSITCSAK
jgi:hypothetical protein